MIIFQSHLFSSEFFIFSEGGSWPQLAAGTLFQLTFDCADLLMLFWPTEIGVLTVVPDTIEPGARASHWNVTAYDIAEVVPRALQYVRVASRASFLAL